MNKFYSYLSGVIFVIIGLLSLLGIKVPSKISGFIEPSFNYGINSMLIGMFFLLLGYFLKEKKQEYTICPKCEETFNYDELEDGKCKYCEDVDTIDMEDYYKEQREKKE